MNVKRTISNILKCVKYSNDYNQLVATIGYHGNALIMDSYGCLNKDKTIFLIEDKAYNVGLFGILRQILDAVYIGDKLGIPIYISINHSWYNIDINDPTDNVYEYFFEQPYGLDYKTVHSSYCVIKSDSRNMRCIRYFMGLETSNGYEICKNDEYIDTLAQLKKKYIKYSNQTTAEFEKQEKLFSDKKKICGIHFRGTDYGIPVKNHPIPLRIEDFYVYIDKMIEDGYDSLFIATDDESALDKIKKDYEARIAVLYNDGIYRSNDGQPVFMGVHRDGDSPYKRGIEALKDMYMLSRCDSIIYGESQVPYFAQIEKRSRDEKFENNILISKGYYMRTNYWKLWSMRKKWNS